MLLIHPVSIGFRSIECPARHGPRNIVGGRLRGNCHSAERPPSRLGNCVPMQDLLDGMHPIDMD